MDLLTTADVSRDIYLKAKNYVMHVMQQGKPLVDADQNELTQIFFEMIRDFIRVQDQDCFHEDGFKIEENDLVSGTSNNFKVNSGYAYPGGWQSYLDVDVEYISDGTTIAELAIHSKSSAVTSDVLTDLSMNWFPGELVGRVLIPNVNDPLSTEFAILSNTVNSITVSYTPPTDLTSVSAEGNPYMIKPSTPTTEVIGGVDRRDSIWLNSFPFEITSAEDADIIHPIGGGLECERRIQIRTVVHVLEDSPTYGDYPDTYQDDRGTLHYMLKIGEFERVKDDDDITTVMIIDSRKESIIQRLSRWLGSSVNLHDETLPYTSTFYIKNYMSFIAALSRLDQVMYASGAMGELGVLAGKCGEDLATIIGTGTGTPPGPPYYSGPDYAILDGQHHNLAISNIDAELNRLKAWLGKADLAAFVPDYSTYTGHYYIGVGEPTQSAVGKLDQALKDEELERGVQDGLIRADLLSTAIPGASLVGIDASTIDGVDAPVDDAQGAFEVIGQVSHAINLRRMRHEKHVVALFNTAPSLDYVPVNNNDVWMFVGDVPQVNGPDYTVAGQAVGWISAVAGFTLEVGDEVIYHYWSVN